MFQYVNITHSDTDPGLDPADISTTPPAPPFLPNDSHPQQPQQQPQHQQQHVPYNVHQPLELPLVNSDTNPPSNKLDQQQIHNPVNGIFQNPDSHNIPSHHRSIDHVINHPSLSPPHPDPHLTHQDPDPSQFHRSSDKPPTQLQSVSLPLPLPPPQRPPHQLQHSQSQSTQSWGMPLPLAPPLPTQHHSSPLSRIRPQIPSDHVYYSSNPSQTIPSSHVQPSPPVNPDNFRHINVRPYRTPAVHREIDSHQHRSPRKRQKRSLVWNFFKESETDPNVAFCLICNQGIPRGRNLARNTTNLRKHLEHRHPEYNVNNQNILGQQAKRAQPAHISVAPSPSPLTRQDIDEVSGSVRNRNNSFLFQHNPTPHRPPPDDRLLAIQPQPPPQIPISQDRSALSLSPATVYHGATHEGKPDPQFRQSQSLEESSSLVPTSIKRCNSSSNPLQMNQIPVSNLYNSQPQGSTQVHAPDLTESGPNARNKDPRSWDPKSLRPPKRFFPEGDDGEEANSNGDRQPATQEASAALVKFLAAAGLPLSMAKSRSLLDLLDVTSNRPYFPNAIELRDHVLPNQVTLLHSKIRSALSSADIIVATIEKRDKNRLLVCHYFAQNFSPRSVCLDVIHPAEVKEGFFFGGKPASTENSAFLQSRSEQMTAENSKRIRKLLQRVSNNFDYWKITHKVNAVVVAEKGITADNSHFLPEPSNSGNLPSIALREPPDTSSKSSRRPPHGSDHGPGTAYDQAIDTGSSVQNKIPVLSCLISTIERIITETICQSDLIARCFIEPLSRGMFKALTDREFLLSEASQVWSSDIKLPVCNPSPWELRTLFSFYDSHMETVQHAVKRVDPKDLAFLCLIKRDITFLHSLLETFASSVRNIEPMEVKGRASKRERTSTALPVMRNLLKSLETLHGQVGDSLRAVTTDVVRAVRFQANTMEKQHLYACATLLDPRFKSRYLSKDVLDELKNNVKDACAAESRRREGRSGKTSESMGNQGGNQSNALALEHYMESIIPEQSFSSSALSTYLSEPTAGFNDDIDDYWNRNQGRWPILARVASRYTVIPCSCGSERISKVLLGSPRRKGSDLDLSMKEIQALSAMELLRMNTV